MLRAAIVVLAVVLAVSSCKKKEEEKTTPTLGGSVDFSCSQFIGPGETVEFPRPKGIIHQEGKPYGVKWMVTPGPMKEYQVSISEDGSVDSLFKYTFPDSLGTYTVICNAFASGYYSVSSTKKVTVVKGGYDDGTLQYRDMPSYDGTDTDSRDQEVYRYVNIGGMKWMQRNLHYAGLGKPYQDCKAMCDVSGMFYSWDEAMKACPQGWKLPTLEQWKSVKGTLEGVAGDFLTFASCNGENIMEWWPDVKINNSTRLSIVFFGYSNLSAGTFEGIASKAAFWTADKLDDKYAKYIYILDNHTDILEGKGDIESFGATVRCVSAD